MLCEYTINTIVTLIEFSCFDFGCYAVHLVFVFWQVYVYSVLES